MKTLFILSDGPYGTERSYNALRLVNALAKRDGELVKVFLLGDAAACAKAGQKVPSGYYCIETMLKAALHKQVECGACGTCLEARGLQEPELIQGVHRSTMEQLADWTQWADKVLIF